MRVTYSDEDILLNRKRFVELLRTTPESQRVTGTLYEWPDFVTSLRRRHIVPETVCALGLFGRDVIGRSENNGPWDGYPDYDVLMAALALDARTMDDITEWNDMFRFCGPVPVAGPRKRVRVSWAQIANRLERRWKL